MKKIPLIQDEDYDDYNTPNTGSTDETSFTVPDTSEATSTLQLRLDKITALYSHLNVTNDPGLAGIDRFIIKKIQEQTTLTCFSSMVIINGNRSLINLLVNF